MIYQNRELVLSVRQRLLDFLGTQPVLYRSERVSSWRLKMDDTITVDAHVGGEGMLNVTLQQLEYDPHGPYNPTKVHVFNRHFTLWDDGHFRAELSRDPVRFPPGVVATDRSRDSLWSGGGAWIRIPIVERTHPGTTDGPFAVGPEIGDLGVTESTLTTYERLEPIDRLAYLLTAPSGAGVHGVPYPDMLEALQVVWSVVGPTTVSSQHIYPAVDPDAAVTSGFHQIFSDFARHQAHELQVDLQAIELFSNFLPPQLDQSEQERANSFAVYAETLALGESRSSDNESWRTASKRFETVALQSALSFALPDTRSQAKELLKKASIFFRGDITQPEIEILGALRGMANGVAPLVFRVEDVVLVQGVEGNPCFNLLCSVSASEGQELNYLSTAVTSPIDIGYEALNIRARSDKIMSGRWNADVDSLFGLPIGLSDTVSLLKDSVLEAIRSSEDLSLEALPWAMVMKQERFRDDELNLDLD